MNQSEFLYAVRELFPNRKNDSFDELYHLISDLIPKAPIDSAPVDKNPNWVKVNIIKRMLSDRGLDYEIDSIEEVYGYDDVNVNYRITFKNGHTMTIYSSQYFEYLNKFM